MTSDHTYPGTPQHQALLHQIFTYYHDDPRILALLLFGSLARGTWDAYSDLDLDVVIRDDVRIDVLREVRMLCATFSAIGERAILIAPDKIDAADVVLASLCELSIRYHQLAATSPNIVESVQLLSGRIAIEQVKAAGTANIRPHPEVEADPVDTFIRLALAVNRELHRQQFWQALSLLERMRALVVDMFAHAHGGGRPYTVFQAQAPRRLREKLAAALPQPAFASLQRAFFRLLDIVEQEYRQLGKVHGLSTEQQTILVEIRQRQQSLQFDQIDE